MRKRGKGRVGEREGDGEGEGERGKTPTSTPTHTHTYSQETGAVTTTHGDPATTNRTIACLPETYTSIPPATLTRVDPPLPKHEGPNISDCHLISQAMQEEYGYA